MIQVNSSSALRKPLMIMMYVQNNRKIFKGSYKVIAKNRLGEVSAAIALNFAAETAQKSLQDGTAPNFIQKPVIRPEADGKRICFECKLKADPQPQLSWYRDNVQIHDTGLTKFIRLCHLKFRYNYLIFHNKQDAI